MGRLSIGLACLLLGGCATRDVHFSRTLSRQAVMMGCLNPGPTPHSYVLNDYYTGQPTPVTGGGKINLYASNHAVKLIGIYQTEAGWEGLRVLRIEQVAGSCETPFPARLPGWAAERPDTPPQGAK